MKNAILAVDQSQEYCNFDWNILDIDLMNKNSKDGNWYSKPNLILSWITGFKEYWTFRGMYLIMRKCYKYLLGFPCTLNGHNFLFILRWKIHLDKFTQKLGSLGIGCTKLFLIIFGSVLYQFDEIRDTVSIYTENPN